MKNLLFSACILFLSCNFLFGQAKHKFVKMQQHFSVEAPRYNTPENIDPLEISQTDLASRRCENTAGSTFHDVQTYNSMPSMLHNYAGGRFSVIWQTGEEADAGFSDRGTGYNYDDGTGWTLNSSDRIEGDVRTGFPAFTVLANETEVVAAHKTPAPYEIRTYSKTAGTSDWTEQTVPSSVSGGPVWPFIASGGTDGNSIHIIAVSVATAFGGVIYEGMDQHLLYWRSQDGGATWDISDQIIPGCDSTFYDGIDASAYSIDASGNTVAIGVFDSWGDIVVLKSEDNGTNWERIVVKDFPLDKYVTDSGYSYSDLNEDPNAPDSLAINTSDGAGAILIDNNGMVHVFYGNMYVTDQNLANNATEYYPTTSGIMYWNESFGSDSVKLIADVVDFNGNDTLDVETGEYGDYGTGLSSHPSVGIDENNRIYMAYTAVREDYYDNDEQQHFRHVFITYSSDNGLNWTEPVDAIDASCIDFSSLLETMYPSVARNVDEYIHFTYLQDFNPGLGVWLEDDDASENSVILTSLDKNTLEVVSIENLSIEEQRLKVFPNPSKDNVEIQIELQHTTKVDIELLDQMGRKLKGINSSLQNPGIFNTHFSVKSLTSGLYVLKTMLNNKILIEKIIVQ